MNQLYQKIHPSKPSAFLLCLAFCFLLSSCSPAPSGESLGKTEPGGPVPPTQTNRQIIVEEANRFLAYSEAHPESSLYQHLVGVSTLDDSGLRVLLLCDGDDGCSSEIAQFDFQIPYSIDSSVTESFPGVPNYPYHLQKERADELAARLLEIRVHGNSGEGTAAEKEFLLYNPRIEFGLGGPISVVLTASNTFRFDDPAERSNERAVALFEELVGKQEGIIYAFPQ